MKVILAAALMAVATSAYADQGVVTAIHSGGNCFAVQFSDKDVGKWFGFSVQIIDASLGNATQAQLLMTSRPATVGYDVSATTVPCLAALGPVHIISNINAPPLATQ